MSDDKKRDDEDLAKKKIADDESERPGSGKESHEAAENRVDQWEEESFPGSDPPAPSGGGGGLCPPVAVKCPGHRPWGRVPGTLSLPRVTQASV
ncbi:MAG: hypothetical protein ACTH02_01645 [Corynebacterium sp.]